MEYAGTYSDINDQLNDGKNNIQDFIDCLEGKKSSNPDYLKLDNINFQLNNITMNIFNITPNSNIPSSYKGIKNDTIKEKGPFYYVTILISSSVQKPQVLYYQSNNNYDTKSSIFQKMGDDYKNVTENLINSLQHTYEKGTKKLIEKWEDFTVENMNNVYEGQSDIDATQATPETYSKDENYKKDFRIFFFPKDNKLSVFKPNDNQTHFILQENCDIRLDKTEKSLEVNMPAKIYSIINSGTFLITDKQDPYALILADKEKEETIIYRFLDYTGEWMYGRVNTKAVEAIKNYFSKDNPDDSNTYEDYEVEMEDIKNPRKSSGRGKTYTPPTGKDIVISTSGEASERQAREYSESLRYLNKRIDYLERKKKGMTNPDKSTKEIQKLDNEINEISQTIRAIKIERAKIIDAISEKK